MLKRFHLIRRLPSAIRQLVFVAVLVALPAVSSSAQVRGTRFELTAVGDSTVSFPIGTAQWVHHGLTGVVVNPRQRDALVARFRIIDIDAGVATALITGQTTRLLMEHVAILEEPRKRFFKTLGFWGGVVIGFVIGVVAGAQ